MKEKIAKSREKKNRQEFLNEHKSKIRSMPKPEIKKAESKIPEGKKVILETVSYTHLTLPTKA